nr:RNA-directed DNA polymerase, eukaryota, reverse transcriptase zinc-binding domain protein [Tanacetum cinerariifolium]
KVLTAKDKGGLGVPSLYALNRGLLLKWVWRFYAHSESLWSRVIKAIHGNKGGFECRRGIETRSCWTVIILEVKKLQSKGINFFEFMQHKMGSCLILRWTPRFAANQGGAEESQFVDMSELLNTATLRPCEDRFVWSLENSESLQKAKIKWSVEGDENSHFFHGILNKMRKQMSIRGVMKDGVWLDKPDQEELESDVTREEIKRAVWDCGVDKSPSPDVLY